MTDPHGYQELYEELGSLRAALQELGAGEQAERLDLARSFYGAGSATEFMGESLLAIEAVLASVGQLPADLTERFAALATRIRQGFDSAWGP